MYLKIIKRTLKLTVLHSLYWFSIQMTLAHFGTKIPNSFFEKNGHIFRIYSWENNGKFWNRILKVNQWKYLIPEGSKLNSHIYNKNSIEDLNIETLKQVDIEMKRAELIHWLSIIPVIIFVKSSRYIQIINLIYVLFSHIPVILVQRYNRPRLEKLIRLIYKRG